MGQAVRIDLVGTTRWMFVAGEWDASEELAEAISMGASAAITLGSKAEELDLAFRALLSSDSLYLSHSAAQWIAEAALRRPAEAPAPPSLPSLTVREQEVLLLVAQGLSNDEIAAALTISPSTVRTHIHSLAIKLDTSSRASLIARAQGRELPRGRTRPVPLPQKSA
ncbi:MAG: response regulator transcription factor [Dehalococcoidia bacterium]|nr:response regulator transcription factor [Dehalococcoidia bacterium]